MSNPSHRKGFGFELEVVHLAESYGLTAYRCWGSDGRSHGLSKDVDVLGDGDAGVKLQTKRRKSLPRWLGMSDDVDGVVLRGDRGESVVVVRLEWLLAVLHAADFGTRAVASGFDGGSDGNGGGESAKGRTAETGKEMR